MRGTDDRSLSSLALKPANPNFARKSPIRSMGDFDFDKDDGLYFSALHQMGFCNLVYMEVYGDKRRQEKSALGKAGFIYRTEAPEDAPFVMALNILNTALARHMYDNSANLVVIAKQSPKSELNRVLHCLKSRNIPVLVVQPPHDTAQDCVFHSVDALVDCTHLLSGEKPISIRPQSSAYDHGDAFRWRE